MNNSDTLDAFIVLENKLKNSELTIENNRIKIDSLVRENQKLKDTLIQALCKVADIEHDL
jgi:hypothetical protein